MMSLFAQRNEPASGDELGRLYGVKDIIVLHEMHWR